MNLLYEPFVWTFCMSLLYEPFVWTVCTNLLYEPFVRTFCTNLLYEPFVRTVCTNLLYEPFVWTFCMNRLYEPFVWTFCMNLLYEPFVWTVCMNLLYEPFVWTVCRMNRLPYEPFVWTVCMNHACDTRWSAREILHWLPDGLTAGPRNVAAAVPEGGWPTPAGRGREVRNLVGGKLDPRHVWLLRVGAGQEFCFYWFWEFPHSPASICTTHAHVSCFFFIKCLL